MKVTRQDNMPSKILFTFEPAMEGGIAPEAITFDADRVHSSLHHAAEMHGWEQRLRDNAAIARKQSDGTIITVTDAMRREAVLELVNHYHGGSSDWSIKKASTPKAAARNPVWEAIAAKKGVTYEAYIAERAEADLAELAAM